MSGSTHFLMPDQFLLAFSLYRESLNFRFVLNTEEIISFEWISLALTFVFSVAAQI